MLVKVALQGESGGLVMEMGRKQKCAARKITQDFLESKAELGFLMHLLCGFYTGRLTVIITEKHACEILVP